MLRCFAKMLLPQRLQQIYRARSLVIQTASRFSDTPEVGILPALCPRGCTAVDVGANQGVFTVALARLAWWVHAFEPQPALAQRLRDAFCLRTDVMIYNMALSDRNGSRRLRIPEFDGLALDDLATTAESNDLDGMETRTITVTAKPLDAFDLERVKFMKIDVEGSEMDVLRGAENTLRRCHPNLLIEIEERHRRDAVGSAIRFLSGFGYQGWFIWGDELVPAERFDARVHQRSDALDNLGRMIGRYAANWVFRPAAT